MHSVLFDTSDTCSVAENDDPSLWEDIDTDDVEAVFSNLPVRMSCFAHSLQLVVRDGLASMGLIRSALAKCSKLTNLVHQSPVFRSAFEAQLGAGKAGHMDQQSLSFCHCKNSRFHFKPPYGTFIYVTYKKYIYVDIYVLGAGKSVPATNTAIRSSPLPRLAITLTT